MFLICVNKIEVIEALLRSEIVSYGFSERAS
jgi:hypothetical protein